MTAVRSPRFFCATAAALTMALASSADAQVPPGHAVVGTFCSPATVGTSGLFLVSLANGTTTRISGLPIELEQAGGSVFQQGVATLAMRETDGAIVVGTAATYNGPTQGRVDLFVLHLTGTAVDPARSQRITLGTASVNGGAFVAPLPDGRILIVAGEGAGPFTNGPMANHVAAIVDTSTATPAFTLLPAPLSGGNGGGLAVDATGRIAYYTLTVGIGSPSGVATLYRWDLTNNTSCAIATWPGYWSKGLACDDDGTVYVGLNNGTTRAHSVRSVVPDGCNPATSSVLNSSMMLPPSSLALDRAAGRFVMATPGFAPGFPTNLFNSLAVIDQSSGNASILVPPPPGGWGGMSAAAVHNAMETYGPASDGQNRYWFDNFPNAGGLPVLGNASFSLTLRAEPGLPALSALAFSLGRGSFQVAGIELLLDLGSMTTLLVPIGTTVPLAFPIPSDPLLVGLLTVQTVHVEANSALASSRGLAIEIR